MRRRVCFIWLFCLLFGVFFGGSVSVAYAEDVTQQSGREQLEDKIDELLSALDTKELEEYFKTLAPSQEGTLKERLKGVITGDFSVDYNNLAQSLLTLAWDEFTRLLPAFAVILASALVCGVLNSAKIGFLQSSMSDVIGFVGYLGVGGVVLSCLLTVLSAGFDAIASMQKQMELVYPLLLTLMAGSGGAVSVAVYRPAVAFFSSVITHLFTSVVLPVAVLLIVLSFVGNLFDEVKTSKLSDFFKGILKWIIGLSLGLFSIFLTVQGLSSAQYDGLSLRAAKYAISNSVPIVGGFLSGGLDVVLAGSAILKNALGSFSIFLLFATLLRPLVLFIVFQLFLRLCAAVTDPVGGKISTFLSSMANDLGYFIAGLLCIAFLYFLTIVLFVCSSGVVLS